jgi:chorismate mutase/prephenate dehydrogenase
MKKLDEFRDQVRTLDQQLIGLIGKRIELAKKIGETKHKEGIPLRNWEIEKTVIQHAEDCARKQGISSMFVRSIMQQLIEEGRIEQERLHYSAYQGDKERILVVGGLGDMGKWFCYFFQNQGHAVSLYDVKGISDEFISYKTLEQGLKQTSIVCIAVSLEMTSLVIEEITDTAFSGIVFDIASLKGHLAGSIERARQAGVRITSIHPMFGPGARTLADKILCLCKCGCPDADARVEGLFKDTAATLVPLSIDEHDRIISLVLGLSHFINIVFIKTLMQEGIDYSLLKRVASTTFLSQMVTTSSVIQENPYLYYAIQRLNPYKDQLYSSLCEVTAGLSRIVLEGREGEFIQILRDTRAWLEEQ